MRVPNPSSSATTHWVKIGGESLHCVGKPCKTLLVSSHYVMFFLGPQNNNGRTRWHWITLKNVPETQDLSSKMSYITKGALGLEDPSSDLPSIAWHPLAVVPDITTNIVATRIMAPKQCRKPKRSNCPSYPTIGTAGSVGRKMRTDESLELWSGVSLRAFKVFLNMFVLVRSC